jgi:hypothetical protein
MAWAAGADGIVGEQRTERSLGDVQRLPDEALLPLLSGAYARGIADLLGRLALPVMFLSRDGRVLHANAQALAVSGPAVQVQAEHVVARSAAHGRQLDDMLGGVMRSRRPARITLASTELAPLIIYALPFESPFPIDVQLADLVLLLDDGADPIASALMSRMSGMHSERGGVGPGSNKGIDAEAASQ